MIVFNKTNHFYSHCNTYVSCSEIYFDVNQPTAPGEPS